jgi:hypothetical protein
VGEILPMTDRDDSEQRDSKAEYPYSVETGVAILRSSVVGNLEELVGKEDRAALRDYAQSVDREQLHRDLEHLGKGTAMDSPLPYIDPDSMSDKGDEIYTEFQQRAVRGPFDIPDIESLEFRGMAHTVTMVFENGARLRYVHVPSETRHEYESVAPEYDEEDVMMEIYRSKDVDDPFDSKILSAGPLEGSLEQEFALLGLEGYYEVKRGENAGMWLLEKLFDADPTIREER